MEKNYTLIMKVNLCCTYDISLNTFPRRMLTFYLQTRTLCRTITHIKHQQMSS